MFSQEESLSLVTWQGLDILLREESGMSPCSHCVHRPTHQTLSTAPQAIGHNP